MAQDDKTERARIHLKAAIAYYDEARYDDAAREMEAAYELKPLPDLQYNLAQCYERLGRYDRRGRRRTRPICTASRRRPIASWCETRIDNLRERARGDGGGIAGGAAAAVGGEGGVQDHRRLQDGAAAAGTRRARCAAYGLGVLALGALASGIAFAVLAQAERRHRDQGRLDDEPADVRRHGARHAEERADRRRSSRA